MEITRLRQYIVHPPARKNLLFVALDTNEELTGWGECYTQADRDTQIAAHLDQLVGEVEARYRLPPRLLTRSQALGWERAARRPPRCNGVGWALPSRPHA